MNRRNFLVGTLASGALSPLLARLASAGQRRTGFKTSGGARLQPGLGGFETISGAPAEIGAVQILVFDTFGTVVDWRASVIAEGEKLGRAKGLKVDWAAFADAWRGGYGPSMNRVRTGQLPWTKLDVLHRMVLDELLVRFKIEGLSEDEKKHFNRAWHRLHGWPDAAAGLTRLRKRFVIAPLSNGNLALLTNMAKFAGLPWDCILSTELVRHYKPDKETYLMVPEFFDVEPAAVMMVAAHEGDLQAARKLGLRTAYVHRPLERGPARTPTAPDPGRFDFLAKDFRDLATQLGA